jgi:hypothetical protein
VNLGGRRAQLVRGAGLLVLTGLLVGCSDFLGSDGSNDPPRLESSTPSAGATGVSVLSGLTLRFNTALNPVSVPEGVGLEVAGRSIEVEWTLPDERTLVLTPTDPLDFGTDHTVTVTPTLVSFRGVPAESTTSWTFTTRGLPPPSRTASAGTWRCWPTIR